MQLLAIDIANFRSIRQLSEQSCGPLNVLIGKNNAGKSNILSAFHAFFSFFHSRDVVRLDPPIREQIDFFNQDVSDPVALTFRFGMDNSDRERLFGAIISETPQVKHLVEALPAELDLAMTVLFNPPPAPFAVLKSVELT